MASRALKIDPHPTASHEKKTVTTKTMEEEAAKAETTEESVAVLAYQHWVERGCPIGSPEVDWFQAEAELRNAQHPASASA